MARTVHRRLNWRSLSRHRHLLVLAGEGIKNVISIPVGFVSDHVEILFDIDIQAQAVARELGMRLVRPPALNDDPLYIETLVDLIQARAVAWLPAMQTATVGEREA